MRWLLLTLLLMSGSASAAALDLNQASPEELQKLPGIGQKKAESIVAFRAQHAFRRPTEIMRVKGIGPKLFAKVKGSICAGLSCAASPEPSHAAAPSAGQNKIQN